MIQLSQGQAKKIEKAAGVEKPAVWAFRHIVEDGDAPMPPVEVFSSTIWVRVTETQYDEIRNRATAIGYASVTDYARARILAAAKSELSRKKVRHG